MNDALDIDDNDEENDSGIPLGAEQRGTTLPDALAVWLGPVADAAAELDSDALSDADFVAKLKACADMEFGDSGAFEKLETADMEAAYGTADQTRKR